MRTSNGEAESQAACDRQRCASEPATVTALCRLLLVVSDYEKCGQIPGRRFWLDGRRQLAMEFRQQNMNIYGSSNELFVSFFSVLIPALYGPTLYGPTV